jgi:uncharacterized protein (TIGR02453 family)
MVEPETFKFLADLAINNSKVWMDKHKSERDEVMRNFTGIATTLHHYAHRFDYLVADARSKPKQSFTKFFQEPRDRIGRALYRVGVDVFAHVGHSEESFGYYLHIEPGNCHAGAALFQPSKEAHMRSITRLVDDPQGLKAVLDDPKFKKTFPEGLVTRKTLGNLPVNLKSDGFVEPFLRMVGLGCRKNLPDALLLDDDVIDELVEIFRPANQLVRYFE